MISREEAFKLVERHVNQVSPIADDYLIVCPEDTIEKPYGWVVFYAPKRFVETGDPEFLPAGGAPFLVQKDDGRLVPLGIARPLETYLKQYEQGLSQD
jgi:hypothetical protein